MPNTQHSRWHDRDLPFLVELVRLLDVDPTGRVATQDVVNSLGWETDDGLRARKDLLRDGLAVTPPAPSRGGPEWLPLEVTGEALRLASVWPTPESALDQMIAALEQIAEHTEDEDTRTKTRKAIDAFSGGSKHVALAAITSVVTGQMPGGGA